MKKLISCLFMSVLICACAGVQEAKNFANCKYALRSVEITDYDVNSMSFDVYVTITNQNRKTAAAIKKFDGKLTMNDVPVADIAFENVRVEPASSKNQKAKVTVPMKAFSSKLLGLVSMGSASVDYHITGVATFDTPLGEVPVPVDIGRMGNYTIQS